MSWNNWEKDLKASNKYMSRVIRSRNQCTYSVNVWMHFDLIDKVCAESYSDLRAIQFPQSILSTLVDESSSVIVSQERKVSSVVKSRHTQK